MSPFSLGILGSARVASSATYAAAVMADSPAVYYPLGDASSPAVDVTGNTTASSSAWPTFAQPGIGDGSTSAEFNGATFIAVTAATALNNVSAFTLEALIYPTAAARNAIFENDISGTLDRRGFQFYVTPAGALIFTAIASNVATAATSDGLVPVGTVSHVAVTFDGSNMRLYVNGALKATTARTGAINPTGVVNNYEIGRNGRDLYYAQGRLGGIAAYASTLSGTRILAHAQAAGVA